jgi:putative flippase GtrA
VERGDETTRFGRRDRRRESATVNAAGSRLLRLVDPRLLARHQITAALGTTADFGTMVALVELGHLSPPVATILSAIAGGVVNFSLSRVWAYRERHGGSLASQAARYAVGSLGGALLNATLLALFLRLAAVPYPAARAIIAIAISVLYTYPVHTRLVFRVARARRLPLVRSLVDHGRSVDAVAPRVDEAPRRGAGGSP